MVTGWKSDLRSISSRVDSSGKHSSLVPSRCREVGARNSNIAVSSSRLHSCTAGSDLSLMHSMSSRIWLAYSLGAVSSERYSSMTCKHFPSRSCVAADDGLSAGISSRSIHGILGSACSKRSFIHTGRCSSTSQSRCHCASVNNSPEAMFLSLSSRDNCNCACIKPATP
ncbi:hypothetical protein D3C87_1147080 [compost metagenome]